MATLQTGGEDIGIDRLCPAALHNKRKADKDAPKETAAAPAPAAVATMRVSTDDGPSQDQMQAQ
jgi:hypothetical protein